ncbi:MAG: putative metalloprotease CJM1_0395 family protein [Myxococcota bacterium]
MQLGSLATAIQRLPTRVAPSPVEVEGAPADLSADEAASERSVRADERVAATSEADAPEAPPSESELSEDEQREVERLRARDAEVRAHEQAHKIVGGQYAGAIRYDFEVGPDGRRYAVGGSVSIDTSEIPGEPEASIRKMQQVIRAANAPAEPSSQDRKVAADAAAKITRLQAEARVAEKEEAEGAAESDDATASELRSEAVDGDATPDAAVDRGVARSAARALAAYGNKRTPSGSIVDVRTYV